MFTLKFTVCLLNALMFFLYNVELSVGIIGGRDAQPGEFSFMVSLRNETNKHYCGGSLVTRRHVLTAAHCLYTDRSGLYCEMDEMYDPSVIGAIVGSVYSEWLDGDFYGATKLSPHPEYNVTNPYSILHDIGVIELKREIKDQKIVPIALPTKSVNYKEMATVLGWGIDNRDNVEGKYKIARVLQKADIEVMWDEDCVKVYSERISELDYATEAVVRNSAFCCIHDHVNVCYRDSGSSLIQDNKLSGIVIFGNGCKEGSPDIFTSVFHHLEFIFDRIDNRSIAETETTRL